MFEKDSRAKKPQLWFVIVEYLSFDPGPGFGAATGEHLRFTHRTAAAALRRLASLISGKQRSSTAHAPCRTFVISPDGIKMTHDQLRTHLHLPLRRDYSEAMSAAGRLGGTRRAASLSPQRRHEIARAAATARWLRN